MQPYDPRPQLEAHPPRSDVATRMQLVPCPRCDRPILAPQGYPPPHPTWREHHHEPRPFGPPVRMALPFHTAEARATIWAADGERFTIWAPAP